MGKAIPTTRLKSGAESTLKVAHLGRAEIFALPSLQRFAPKGSAPHRPFPTRDAGNAGAAFPSSLHTCDQEAFGFEGRPDLGDLVALDFYGPVLHRAAGATRGA